MARIDALLSLAVSQGAEALSLVDGEAPTLIKAGEVRRLSMPPLSSALFELFVEEVDAVGPKGVYVHKGRDGDLSFNILRTGPSALELRCEDVPAAGGPPQDSGVEPMRRGRSSELTALVERALEVGG